MTTRWIDPTLSLMDQPELDPAWTEYWRQMFIIADIETDSEDEAEEEEFGDDEEELGDEPWEEGPQTPPLGPRPPTWRRLVAIGGGLAMSVDETDSEEEDEEWTLSSASSVSTEYRE